MPVQLPLSAVSCESARGVPVRLGSATFAIVAALIGWVAAERAVAVPPGPMAVTRPVRAWPKSAVTWPGDG